jgi:hypothetical protein
MSFLGKICGKVRNVDAPFIPDTNDMGPYHLSKCGAKLLVESLPSRASLVAEGNSWQFAINTLTANNGIPGASCMWGLFNGEPAGGKVYIVDSVAVTKSIIDVTTNDYFTVYGQVVNQLLISHLAPTVTCSLSGRRGTESRYRTNQFTCLLNNWDNIGGSQSGAYDIAGSAWQQVDIDLFGKYVLIPGNSFGITISETTATSSVFRICLRWHEVQLPYVT